MVLFKKVLRKLSLSFFSSGGRNFQGRATVLHRGSGVKRRYRLIDFSRKFRFGCPGIIRRIERDPKRNCFISLILFRNGFLVYELAIEGKKVGDILQVGESVELLVGNSLPLKRLPIGVLVSNIEFFFEKGGQLCRSAGSFAKILKHFGENSAYVVIELPSGEQRLVDGRSFVTLGIISNVSFQYKKFTKAGQRRWRGFRPVVRGEAKNPVDHPHGGSTSGGRFCSTPRGNLTRGVKTRSLLHKASKSFIFKKRN